MDPKLLNRIQKIAALAELGVGGERINAQRILEKYLLKYNLTLDNIETATLKEYWFRYSNPLERRLLAQVIASIMGCDSDIWSKATKQRMLGVNASDADAMLIQTSWNIYRNAWKVELDILYSAFIHKHNIFDPNAPNAPYKKRTPEEEAKLFRMFNIVSNLKCVSIHKQIGKSCE